MDLIIEHKLAWSRPRHPDWTAFNRRVGVKWGTFAQRLARARLLCLRRREVTAHWLALAALVAIWPGGNP